MKAIGNLIWFVFGGLILGISWLLSGLLWCITIIGIPIGLQCFKLSKMAFFPFGKDISYSGVGAVSTIANILWVLLSGWVLALEAAAVGCVFCITIIGIPFGLQCFKIARLALVPFGARVVAKIV